MNHSGKTEVQFSSELRPILRDYFAGQAMLALMPARGDWRDHAVFELADLVASGAYAMADAMLKERDK